MALAAQIPPRVTKRSNRLGSPCAFRAWPVARTLPSGPLGWQRLRRSGVVLKIVSAER